MKKYRLIITVTSMCLWLFSSAQAHMLWLTPSNYQPKAGETIRIKIGFGHEYPHGEMEKEGRLERVYAVTPDGRDIDAQPISPSTYTFTTEIEGTYRFYAALKPGFVSNTTEGRTMGNKKTLPNVVSCFAYRISAMTIVKCDNKPQQPIGKGELDLEILPLKDTADVKSNDTIPLQVLFQGKPLSGIQVMAVCSACVKDSDDTWPRKAATDDDGIARIKRTSGGEWMFTVRHKMPYPNTDECDEYSYCTSLTLDF